MYFFNWYVCLAKHDIREDVMLVFTGPVEKLSALASFPEGLHTQVRNLSIRNIRMWMMNVYVYNFT